MLKTELGDYSGTNTVADLVLDNLLINKQKYLASEYNWPFLEERWDSTVTAGQQFVAIPTVNSRGASVTINFERPLFVERYYNQIYSEIEYGIGAEEYNVSNLAKSQANDPIQRWRFSTNVNEAADANQFEVWPVPVTAQTIRFSGQRNVIAVTAGTGSDTFDLDDLMLVLLVAGEKLIRSGQPDGQLKLQMGERRMQKLKQGYPVPERAVILGGASYRSPKRKLTPLMVR